MNSDHNSKLIVSLKDLAAIREWEFSSTASCGFPCSLAKSFPDGTYIVFDIIVSQPCAFTIRHTAEHRLSGPCEVIVARNISGDALIEKMQSELAEADSFCV